MRIAVDLDPRAAFSLVCGEKTRHFPINNRARGFRNGRQMQPAVEPDAAFHFLGAALLRYLQRLESDDERGNYLIGLRRINRQRDDFIDRFSTGAGVAEQITNLRRLRQGFQRELLFFIRAERADIRSELIGSAMISSIVSPPAPASRSR